MLTCFIFWIYNKYEKKYTWFLLFGLMAFCSFMVFTLILSLEKKLHDFDQFGPIYTKPYCRFTPYAIGIMCGLTVVQYRTYQSHKIIFDPYAHNIANFFQKPFVRYTFFIIGMIILNGLILIQRNGDQYFYEHFDDNWTVTQNAFFRLFYYPLYALSLSFILLPVLLGFMKLIF